MNDLIANAKTEKEEQNSQIIIPCRTDEKKFQVCDMCGHANPEHAAMCEMCSNYLILGKGD